MNRRVVYVFDNDGTLYDCHSEFNKAVTEKMIACIARLTSMSTEQVLKKRQELFKRYNVNYTLLVFSREGIITDIDSFIQETYLSVNPLAYGVKQNLRLRKALERLNAHLYVHTNNPSVFASKILDCLGIRDLFTAIYGMFENDSCQKPDFRAFQNILKAISPYKVWWYADNEGPNLIMAKQLGFKTIAVAEAASANGIQADRRLKVIDDLQ